ncbi:MAG TPA: Crp/Fnr family transcriptional regulator [Longimicrobium sp.]|nr:Crp/Fnr family transcriptional regulator [Longimicrobium sp.]
MTETMRALRALPLFARLDERALGAVERRTVVRSVGAGTVLFRKGEACAGLHVVLMGEVRVYRAATGGREQVIHTGGAGQPLAEVPLFDGGPYPASARATETSRVLFLPRDDFAWLYGNHPEIADAVIRDLGRRLRRLVGLVEKISLRDVPARVALSLMEYAEAAGALRDGGELVLPRTQEELAGELATTRESVARALARLRADGAIRQTGRRVRIASVVRLEEAAGR